MGADGANSGGRVGVSGKRLSTTEKQRHRPEVEGELSSLRNTK